MEALLETSRKRPPQLGWILVATVVLAALVWACSGGDSDPAQSGDPTDPGTSSGATSSGTSGATSGGTSGATSGGTSGATSGGTSGATSGGTSGGTSGTTSSGGPIATDASFKVAFIGDTGYGNDFKSVLQLVKRENADLLMVEGDLNYDLFGSATPWFSAIDGEINSGATKIPYIVAKGNHDVSWGSGYAPGLKTRYAGWGVTAADGDPTKTNYSVVYKGLKIVMVDESETSPSRADYVKAQLTGDNHIWKICAWHKNQRNSNVGPKSDEMGWAIYENCRNAGAIIAQAHSHTYSRSKTLSNMTSQTVDTACSDPNALCVGAGKSFFFDSSVGGQDLRPLDSSVSGKPWWASVYSSSFGALFIEFNVGGDPKKAQGYFKTVGNVVIDPPAASGKTTFSITASP